MLLKKTQCLIHQILLIKVWHMMYLKHLKVLKKNDLEDIVFRLILTLNEIEYLIERKKLS